MPFGQDVEIDLFGYGVDWRITDADNNLTHAGKQIAEFAASKGLKEIIAPRTTFNAAFANRQELEKGVVNKETDSGHIVKVLRGPKDYSADAVAIDRGQAYFIASGDCPTLILYHPTLQLLCAHAGRECLWDKHNVEEDILPRRYESVVNTLMDQVPRECIPQVRAYISCGINARNYLHSIDKNAKMLLHFQHVSNWCLRGGKNDVQLSLLDVIVDQLKKVGVPYDHITHDHVNTYADLCADNTNTPQWWSHRRWLVQGRKGIDGRNGVFVIFKK